MNIFDGAKWYEKLRFVLMLPFIILYEIYQEWKEKLNK
jgi:hypothetical protein